MDSGPTELTFQPKLFTNATLKKTVAVSELFKQLKRLSKELNALEQETVDTQSLDAVTKQMLAASLLKHKEPGVISYVACCIADLLRLYAPEAPYNDSEIKTIFNMFIDQLQLLGDTNSQFFALREYLLTSLATVRTPALVATLDDGEELISRFFTGLFGVVSTDMAHSMQMHILDVLQQLLEEPKYVPQEVIDVILLQFTKKRQQDNSAAHQLACDLANGTADVLQKYIYQYFNDIIVGAAQQRLEQREAEGDETRRDRALARSTMGDLRSAHFLILELNKSAPGTLLNVIPQVEEELGVDDVEIRVLATEVLGEMFADKGFTLAKRYDSTWKAWKGRRADSSALVRIQWVEHAVGLYRSQPQLARELNDGISEKLRDVDDKVRQAACHALGQLEYSAAEQAAIDSSVVDALGERCRDRKHVVRGEAIIALATMYSQVHDSLVSAGGQATRLKFGGIPSVIFQLRYVNDPDIDSMVDGVVAGAILDFAKTKDDRARCRRLVTVADGLTSKALNGLLGYMRRQRDIIQLAHVLLGLCERQAEASAPDAQATMGEQLRTMAGKIAGHFPDRTKVEQALVQLGAVQNSDVYSGLRATMDPANDIRTVRKHQRAALKKLSALAPALLDATAPVWKCVGLTTINRALVPHLITLASSPDEPQLGATADKLLRFIADVFPEMLKSSSSELFDVSELRGSDVRLAEERLALMVKFAKAVPRAVPGSTDLQELLAGLVRTGTLRQAKYAAFLLTQMEGSGALCGVLAGDMVDNLDNALLERRAPSFAALARFAQYAPLAFAIYADRVSQFLVQTVLMGTPPPPPADGVADDEVMADGKENAAPEWVERESLDDAGLTKVYAVKILTNWLVGTDRHALTRDGVQTVLGVLRALVRNGGEIQPGTHSGSAHRPHVLLAAAACMVKLARLPHLERLLSQQDALSLALVAQDTCYEVRARFLLRKLVPALVAGRIHVRFVPTLFLVAHDPERTLRDSIRHAVAHRLATARPAPGAPSVAEDCLPRLLLLLAQHPDWDDATPVPTLELFAPYLEFYIAAVAAAHNVSLLFCLAGELKAYRPLPAAHARLPADTLANRLYVLSELAQYLLREKAIAASWPINVYPGQLRLPTDVFEPLPDADKASLPLGPFLDPAFVGRRGKSTASSKRSRPPSKPAMATAATAAAENQDAKKPQRKRVRKQKKIEEDSDEEMASEDDASEVEESDLE